MCGALLGAVVAGVLSWWVAVRTMKSQRLLRYEETFDSALAKFAGTAAAFLENEERWSRGKKKAFRPGVSQLRMDVDAAWMVARAEEDQHVMMFVSQALEALLNAGRWELTKALPALIKAIRLWRTREVGVAQTIAYLGDLERRAAERNWRYS